ncbi:universal stress protein [Calidifontibacillus oryziterrae]|uniref:universal stress protein n=1 Tax=Calidifontibacillus oryziterrae TaxID=1191699 RepID=UPI0003149258|nr:universal stress protein [Calidifontibacillus oryziterrae]
MLTFYSRILVAHDGSELSEKALDMAITLAKQDERIELFVVAVSNPPSAASMGSYGIYSQELIDELRKNTEKLLQGAMEKMKDLPNKATTVVLEGNPGRMIIEYAKNSNCDLIVMGSRGLNAFAELFLGSTSHFVVQRAHCPVFIVK